MGAIDTAIRLGAFSCQQGEERPGTNAAEEQQTSFIANDNPRSTA